MRCETKGDGWKVLGLMDMHNEAFENVSMNKNDLQGKQQWPAFDDVAVGSTIEGNVWKNPTSMKLSIFPPKPQTAPRAGGAPNIKAAQERKAEAIATAQDNKNMGIMIAAAFRDATLILNQMFPDLANETSPDVRLDAAMAMHKRIKERYIREWTETEKSLDTPF